MQFEKELSEIVASGRIRPAQGEETVLNTGFDPQH